MEITKKDFSKIFWVISAIILTALPFLFMLLRYPSITLPGVDADIQSGVVLWIFVPLTTLLGAILFFSNAIRFVTSKSYFSNNLSTKNIGGLMGIVWFILGQIVYLLNHPMQDRFSLNLWWLILAPIIMYIFGFFVDRYTAKKISEGQVK